MKKIMMILVFGVFHASFVTGYATAQRATDISYAPNKIVRTSSSGEGEKTAICNAIDPVDKTALKEMKANLKAAKVSLKITNDLKRNFKNVSDIKWNSREVAIVATLKMNDRSARVVYDKSGNWLYTVTTYNEGQIPDEIRSLVKAGYKGFTISMVQEINEGDINLYKVFLEDRTSLKQILVCDDEITVYADFTKSK